MYFSRKILPVMSLKIESKFRKLPAAVVAEKRGKFMEKCFFLEEWKSFLLRRALPTCIIQQR